jgi:hypothetical protein
MKNGLHKKGQLSIGILNTKAECQIIRISKLFLVFLWVLLSLNLRHYFCTFYSLKHTHQKKLSLFLFCSSLLFPLLLFFFFALLKKERKKILFFIFTIQH